MKKGGGFIFPEDVDKDYGTWEDYTSKDLGYMASAGGLGSLFIILPPYDLILALTKVVTVVLAITIATTILTIKPINARENIKAQDYLKTGNQYAKSQKLYFLEPQKRGGMENELEKTTTK